MGAVLAIETSLDDDGDGVVAYRAVAASADFSAATELWGTPSTHLELADQLTAFSDRSIERVTLQLGTSGFGSLRLEANWLDKLGHIGVWLTVESKHAAPGSERHENATLFLQCDSASVDSFISALRRFSIGSANRAELPAAGPNNSFKGMPLRGTP